MARVVLLTGASGFIGHRLKAALGADADVELHAPDHAALDLCDADAVLAAMQRLQPDVVVHLAAATAGAPTMRAAPTRFFAANLAASTPLAVALERGLCGRVVLAHSAGAYPRPAAIGRADGALQPGDLWRGPPAAGAYGVARRAVGALLEAACSVGDVALIELVLPTVYGPGDGGDQVDPAGLRAVPAFGLRYLDAVAQGQGEVDHFGSGFEVRDFLHVDDAVRAFVAATTMALHPAGPTRLHVSDGEPVRMEQVATRLAAAAGFVGTTTWRHRSDGMTASDDAVVLAPAHLDALGVTPEIGLEDGLRGVVDDLRARLRRHLVGGAKGA